MAQRLAQAKENARGNLGRLECLFDLDRNSVWCVCKLKELLFLHFFQIANINQSQKDVV